MSRDVILTGLRANSEFHIGNYLGAIQPLIKFQGRHKQEYQFNMFIPDLHSLTTPIDHGSLYTQTLSNLKVYVAAGLDIANQNTFIYRQSYIPAHSELAWILDCFTYVGELNRMTQYKEKSDQNSSMGLLNYPVLMAADILLYDAKWIPLGDDQKQHLELARDIATRFNNKFGDNLFTLPEVWTKQLEFLERDISVRVRSLRNPDKKMSKSTSDPAGTILLIDSPKDAKQKILSATTDSLGKINYDWEKQPGVSNLLQLSSLLGGETISNTTNKWQGNTSYGDLKNEVANQVEEFLSDLQQKLSDVDEKQLIEKVERDETSMRTLANKKLLVIQKAVGLRQ